MSPFGYLLETAHWSGPAGITHRLGEHLAYTGAAILIAALVAVPLGLLIGHSGRGGLLARGLGQAVRAVPALGLLVLVVVLLGSGVGPVLAVLVVPAIPPILSATVAGVTETDRNAVHAGRAMGLTAGQLLTRVELPLALPRLFAGLRAAVLLVVATMTIAAYASVGGLGRLIFDGISERDSGEAIAGALLVALLAVASYAVLGGVGRLADRRTHRTAPGVFVLVPTG